MTMQRLNVYGDSHTRFFALIPELSRFKKKQLAEQNRENLEGINDSWGTEEVLDKVTNMPIKKGISRKDFSKNIEEMVEGEV